MFRLRTESCFDAAHKLEEYEGKCSNLHGHTWKVEVFVLGDELDDIGMVVDFKVLKKELKKVIDRFDHSYLNDFEELGNPTSENISRYIFKSLKLPENIELEKVRVWESDGSYAEYFE